MILTGRQVVALNDLFTTLNGHTLVDVGPHLTCSEAETLAHFYRAFEQQELADALLKGHAQEDDGSEGDMHYIEDDGTVSYRIGY